MNTQEYLDRIQKQLVELTVITYELEELVGEIKKELARKEGDLQERKKQILTFRGALGILRERIAEEGKNENTEVDSTESGT